MQPLVVENVVKQFRQGDRVVRALDGVSLEVAQGQFLAVMGASGSGKSTLLHLMAGLTQADGGRVLIAGADLGEMNDRELTLFRRRKVGLVFQSFNLIPTLTAEENVLLPLMLDGRNGDAGDAKVNELLVRLGLSDRRRHRPDAMSGGEQQRVAIARALLARPTVLFADEPTGNLDSTTSSEILEVLRDAVSDYDQTTIMVTHDAKAAAIADRVLFLADGRIVRELGPSNASEVIDVLREVTNG